MFVVLLRFSDGRRAAGDHLDGHQRWVEQGFADGVFLAVGSIEPGVGGGILAHAASADELQRRVDTDPFVVHGVVTPEIIEITPARTDDRLSFLLA